MNKYQWNDMLSNIDERYLMEADPTAGPIAPSDTGPVPRKRLWILPAAAVLLVLLSIPLFIAYSKSKDATIPAKETQAATAQEKTAPGSVIGKGNKVIPKDVIVYEAYGLMLRFDETRSGYNVVGVTDPDAETVTVPPEYDGYPIIGVYILEEFEAGSIDTLVIPAVADKVYEDFYELCRNVKTILVEDGSKTYRAVGNCLINIKRHSLVKGFDDSVIPNDGTVKIIEDDAFRGCTFEKIVIPGAVQTVYNAFKDCQNLKAAVIEEGVQALIGTFYGCTSLQSVDLPSTITNLNSAFRDCTALTAVTIKSKSIVEYGLDLAFSGCSSLQKASFLSPALSGGETELYETFAGTALTEITIPEGVKTLKCAFLYAALKKAELPESIEVIGERAFTGCRDLSEINGIERAKTIWSGSLDGTPYLEKSKYVDEYGVIYLIDTAYGAEETIRGDVALKEGYTTISPRAFKNRSAITSVAVPEGYTAVPEEAFCYCTGLQRIDLPSTVSSIGRDAFARCTVLKELHLPLAVTEFGSSVNFCPSLEILDMPGVVRFGYYRADGTAAKFGCAVGCTALRTITVSEDFYEMCTSLADTAFANDPDNREGGCLYLGRVLADFDRSLETIVIKEGTVSVNLIIDRFGKVYWNDNLTDLYIPKSLYTDGLVIYRLKNVVFEDLDGWTIYKESIMSDRPATLVAAEEYAPDMFADGEYTIKHPKNGDQ